MVIAITTVFVLEPYLNNGRLTGDNVTDVIVDRLASSPVTRPVNDVVIYMTLTRTPMGGGTSIFLPTAKKKTKYDIATKLCIGEARRSTAQ